MASVVAYFSRLILRPSPVLAFPRAVQMAEVIISAACDVAITLQPIYSSVFLRCKICIGGKSYNHSWTEKQLGYYYTKMTKVKHRKT